MSFFTETQKYVPQPTLEEDLNNKFQALYNSRKPFQLIIDSAQRCWEGTKHLKREDVVMPLGFGILSGVSTVNFGEAALNKFRSGHMVHALFYTTMTCFSAYITAYNFNQLANITYEAGGKTNWLNMF